MLIAQGKGKKAPQLWVNHVDLVATNLATRKALMEGERSTLNLRGRVQRSGQVRVEGTLDPWARKPTFTVDGALEHLKVQELYAFLSENAEMRPVSGIINVYAKIKSRNGALEGGVKPVFENLELEASKNDLGARLKAFLADTAVEILSNDEPGKDAVATVVPIKGSIDAPDVQLVPTILGVVRNAFVIGMQSGFQNLPPKTAPEKEGVAKQTVDAVKKGQGPPQAQPGQIDAQKKATQKRARQGKPKPRR